MDDDYRLTKKEGNALFKYAESIGLRPSEFALSDETVLSVTASVLSHLPTGHYFKFGIYRARTGGIVSQATWSPIIDGRVRKQHTHRIEQLEFAGRWLNVVKEEYETVDLWKAAAQEAALVSGGPIDEGDRPFTREEQKVLAERLTQLEKKIIALAQPTPQQQAHLSETIQHAKDATTRTSRIDWKSLFVGKLLDIIVTLGLDPTKAQQVFHYATLYVGPLVSKAIGFLS
jgi:hypothetical protein